MKYSFMLLITLIISIIWGFLLFILGCIFRFQQTMMINNYIANLGDSVHLKSCESVSDPETNICPTKTSFDSIGMGDWANFFGSIVIVTGFLVILLSTSGFIGVLKKSQGLLLVMLVLIIVAIGLEYYLLDIVLGTQSGFHESARDELRERLNTEYTFKPDEVNDFTRMMNAVMLQAECCGIRGPEDFMLNETVTIEGQRLTIKNPVACCEREAFVGNTREEAFNQLLECAKDNWGIQATQTGCYDEVHKYVYDKYGGPLVGFLMFLIIWEGIQGILLFMIILRPAPKSPRKSQASSIGSQRISQKTMQETIRKFVPFSKASSFVGSEINRIKSTEIW